MKLLALGKPIKKPPRSDEGDGELFCGTDFLSPDYAVSLPNSTGAIQIGPLQLTDTYQSFGSSYTVWIAVNVKDIDTLYISGSKNGSQSVLAYVIYRNDTAQFIAASDSYWTKLNWSERTIDTRNIDGILVFCVASTDNYKVTVSLHK